MQTVTRLTAHAAAHAVLQKVVVSLTLPFKGEQTVEVCVGVGTLRLTEVLQRPTIGLLGCYSILRVHDYLIDLHVRSISPRYLHFDTCLLQLCTIVYVAKGQTALRSKGWKHGVF